MCGAGVREPQGPRAIVDGVPDASARGHLELPLLHGLALNNDRAQPPFQPMLPTVGPPWIARDGDPCAIDSSQHLAGQLIPPLRGLPIRRTDEPGLGARYVVTSFRHSDSG